MKLAHIAPLKHIDKSMQLSDFQMVLAHLVLESKEYAAKFRDYDGFKLLDNSFYELGYSLKRDDMLKAADSVGATCVVLADGFDVHSRSHEDLELFKSRGYEVMVVPTAFNELFAAEHCSEVDRIGISGIHIAKIQRAEPGTNDGFSARIKALNLWFGDAKSKKPLHLLGAGNNIRLDATAKKFCDSWDSSAAIWYGLNGLSLRERAPSECKFAEKLDLHSQLEWNELCDDNIVFMRECVK